MSSTLSLSRDYARVLKSHKRWSAHGWNLRLVSKVTPRSVGTSAVWSTRPSRMYRGVTRSEWDRGKRRTILLFTLIYRPHETAVECRRSISWWIGLIDDEDIRVCLADACVLRSSANILNLLVRWEAALFMYVKNSMGPKIEPWETLLSTSLGWLTALDPSLHGSVMLSCFLHVIAFMVFAWIWIDMDLLNFC